MKKLLLLTALCAFESNASDYPIFLNNHKVIKTVKTEDRNDIPQKVDRIIMTGNSNNNKRKRIKTDTTDCSIFLNKNNHKVIKTDTTEDRNDIPQKVDRIIMYDDIKEHLLKENRHDDLRKFLRRENSIKENPARETINTVSLDDTEADEDETKEDETKEESLRINKI